MGTLLPEPLSVPFPATECVFCPGAKHKGGAGPTHDLRKEAYVALCALWTDDAQDMAPLRVDDVSDDASYLESTARGFESGLQMCASPRADAGAQASCALIGISLTSTFDEEHVVQTLAYAARTCDKVRIVIITDPYVSSQTQRALVKHGLWGVGLSADDARERVRGACDAVRVEARKRIVSIMRMVRRWAQHAHNENVHTADTDVPLADGPRFAWIQWVDVVALPLYARMRGAIARVFNTDARFRALVMSIAHHPSACPTDAEVVADAAVDALLTPHEAELFADYFLSEHAFLACVPAWLGCPAHKVFLPYHCSSRAFPFIMSTTHFSPATGLRLVEDVYEHAQMCLAVLPTPSSTRRAERREKEQRDKEQRDKEQRDQTVAADALHGDDARMPQ